MLNWERRPDTTDDMSIDDIVKKRVYDRFPIIPLENKQRRKTHLPPNQVWLDLGGNVGAFSIWACHCGAKSVYCFEPDPENFKQVQTNLQLNPCTYEKVEVFQNAVTWLAKPYQLYVPKNNTRDKWRHTTLPVRGRVPLFPIDSKLKESVGFKDFLLQHPDITAIKMDIEGAEVEILEGMTLLDWKQTHVKYLTFEYHFDRRDEKGSFKDLSRFYAIIHTLQTYFSHVKHRSIPLTGLYSYYPPYVLVFCF